MDRIVSVTWRLRRAGRIETGIYAWRKYSLAFEAALADVRSYEETTIPFALENLFPPETTISNEAEHSAARKRLYESSNLVNSDLPALGRTFVGDANAFATLHRYESGLERSLFKALHELQRLQAFRHGKDVQLPVAVDLHGDSGGLTPES